MNTSFSGHSFILHSSGALIWPAKSLLIVSDMHLEKASHFARRGYFLPPYDSSATLVRLFQVLRETGMERLLILGDSFHDAEGYARLTGKDLSLFEQIMLYDPIWISGNHDGDFASPGLVSVDVYVVENIIFRHEARPDARSEISGHFHPKATVHHKGGVVTGSCFIQDEYKMIMPAFGALAGGLDIKTPVISRLFADDFVAHIVGKYKVYKIT